MATKAKPPRKRKGSPPKAEQPQKNNLEKLATNEIVGLNFKVPPEFKKEYRTYAAEKDMKMIEILMKSFDLYKEQNPI